MADWGLYSALRGKNNWQQKRADAMMDFQMTEALRAKRERENQQRMQMESKFLEYQNAVQNLDVLKEDQERIRGVEKQARQNVVAGIAKYDGDIKRFMSSGGLQTMNAYQQKVMQSDELANAIRNKQNMAQWLADRAKGDRFIKGVKVEKEFTDPKTGKKTKRNVQTTMDEQMALFKEGKLNNFQYNGSEKKVNLGPDLFKRYVKDATNPYSKDNYVTQSNVFDAALMRGASNEQAMQLAQDYGRAVEASGSPENAWRWGAGNPLDVEKLKMQASQFDEQMDYRWATLENQKQWQAYKAKVGAQQDNRIGSFAETTYRKLLQGGDGTVSTDQIVANEIPKIMTNKFKAFPSGKDNVYNAQYMYSGPIFTADSKTVDGRTTTSIAGSQIDAQGLPITIGDPNGNTAFINITGANGQTQLMMPVFAAGSSDNPAFAQAQANGSVGNWKVNEDYVDQISQTAGNSFVGLVPVTDVLATRSSTLAIDKSIGIAPGKMQYGGAAGTASYEDVMQQNLNMFGGDINAYQQMVTQNLGTYYGPSSPGGATQMGMDQYYQSME